MSDAQALLVGIIAFPAIVLGLFGLVRGYHMHLKIWKGDPREDGHDHHADR